MNEVDNNLEDLIYNKKISKSKRNILIIIGILIIIIVIIIIIVVAIAKKDNKNNNKSDEEDIFMEFKQNTFFFFDPVTNFPCNETNYWTPYDQSTTCYRFVSITINDTNKSSTIRIMLDHNIATSNFSNYKNVLNNLKSKWIRYKGIIDIIDESTLSKLMKYANKPNITNSVSASQRTNYYSTNS